MWETLAGKLYFLILLKQVEQICTWPNALYLKSQTLCLSAQRNTNITPTGIFCLQLIANTVSTICTKTVHLIFI